MNRPAIEMPNNRMPSRDWQHGHGWSAAAAISRSGGKQQIQAHRGGSENADPEARGGRPLEVMCRTPALPSRDALRGNARQMVSGTVKLTSKERASEATMMERNSTI